MEKVFDQSPRPRLRQHMRTRFVASTQAAIITAGLLIAGCANAPRPAPQPDAVKMSAFSGQAQRVQFFYSINADCSSSDLPTVWAISPAAHGTVEFRNEDNFTEFPSTNQRYECNKKRSPTIAVYYTAAKSFVGIDRFKVKCIFPAGNAVTKEFLLTVERPQPTHAVVATNVRMDPAHPLYIGEEYYPEASKRLGEQGDCRVKVTVTAEGEVRDAILTKSSGYPRLDQACMDGLQGAHLLPATLDGKPITKTVEVPISWKLSAPPAPLPPVPVLPIP
jgi:TonB family protein